MRNFKKVFSLLAISLMLSSFSAGAEEVAFKEVAAEETLERALPTVKPPTGVCSSRFVVDYYNNTNYTDAQYVAFANNRANSECQLYYGTSSSAHGVTVTNIIRDIPANVTSDHRTYFCNIPQVSCGPKLSALRTTIDSFNNTIYTDAQYLNFSINRANFECQQNFGSASVSQTVSLLNIVRDTQANNTTGTRTFYCTLP